MKKQNVLVFEPKKCIGCRFCELICTMTHFKVTNPKKALIRIIRDHEAQFDFATYCHNCIDAACIQACNFDALSKNPKTNAIQVNKENCTGCKECIHKCPYTVPIMHPTENYILICDSCGGNPECVNICPEHAVQYLDIEKAEQVYKSINAEEVARKLIQEDKQNG